MSEPALFDEPERVWAPPDPLGGLGVDARRTAKQRVAISRGMHPTMGIPLHAYAPPDAMPGDRGRPVTCGTCVHIARIGWHNKRYLKCDLVEMTHGPGSDLRAWWPGCERWEER